MKLGLKIILPILLLLVIVTGAFGYIFYNLKQQESVLSTEGAKIRTLNGLNERLGREQDITVYNVLAYRFNQDRASLLAISQAELDKSKTLDEMYPFITTTRGRELINSYIDARKEVESIRNGLIGAIDGGDQKIISLNYNKWNIQTQNVKAALTDIGAYNINSLEKTLATVGDIRNKISDIIIILVFIVVATVLFLFFYLRMVITIPLIKLAMFADEISRQNFTTTTTTTTTTTRKDELGMLSRAFNTMVVKLKESYTTLEQKVVERTAKLTEKTREAENAQVAALNVLEDLKIQEEKLTIAKIKDDALLQSIGDAVIATDQEGKVIVMNKVVEDILGFTNIDLMGKSFIHEVSQKDAQGNKIPDTERPMTLALDSGKTTTTTTYQFLRKDGSKVPVAITVTPIIIDSKIIGAILVFRDITKEKDIDKAKTEFVAIASHALRTPLTAIRGLVSMILDKEYGAINKDLLQPLKDIETSSERLIHLVNDLLNISRIQVGRMRYELTDLSIAEVIEEVVHFLQPISNQKGIKLVTAKLNAVKVQCDSEKIKEILNNLIGNSFKFTDVGSITVSTKIADDKVYVYISDTGIGIKREDQSKLFGLFQQIESGVGRPIGTGFGLHVSQELILKMGGELWIEKSEVGKGSVFVFSIPRSNSALAKKVKERIKKEAKEHPDQKLTNIVKQNN